MEEKLTEILGYTIIIVLIAALIFIPIQIYRLFHRAEVERQQTAQPKTPNIDDYTYVEKSFPFLLN